MSSPKARAACFPRRASGLCCLTSTPAPLSLTEELTLTPCRGPGLLLTTHCTSRYEGACGRLCLKTGLPKPSKCFENCLFMAHEQSSARSPRTPRSMRDEADMRREMGVVTFSLGSRLMVFRGLKTRSTRRDLIVLISRPLLVLPHGREAHGPRNETERQ